jgi:hypothetical protein
MGSLIFRCPNCRRVIESGLETDEATLRRLRPCKIRLDCDHCQTHHELAIKQGHLFNMKPRRQSVHYVGLLYDEINVGAVVQRALSRT